jgi:FtsZ-interacting cell division protein ZipA
VIVGIVVGVVIVLLLVVMRWADRRDRAKGHVNRGMGEVRATIRQSRLNTHSLRHGGGQSGVPTPHQLARRNAKRQGR